MKRYVTFFVVHQFVVAVVSHIQRIVVVVVSHIQRIGCQPEKTTLHGGQSRSWSAGCQPEKNYFTVVQTIICTILLFIYFIFFTCIGIPIYVGYFVCDSASEFGAMGSTSFFGVFLP